MNIPLLAWSESGSAFGVLPSLVTFGPLALLAWLFPATFGGLALLLRRGIVFCTVLATISTLFLAQASLRSELAGTFWATSSAFWLASLAISGSGVCWSITHPAKNRGTANGPEIGPVVLLGLLGLLCLAIELYFAQNNRLWRDLLPFSAAVWAGFFSACWTQWRPGAAKWKSPLATERAMLCVLTLACGGQLLLASPPPATVGMEIVWAFEPTERGAIVSTPLVTDRHVYIGTIYDTKDRSRGAVYAVDRATGKAVWRFDDDGRMLNMFSTPCLAEGRIYIGEGMHADFASKLYCLDAATGHKIWEFATSNHIESSPVISGDRVYVGAGDDGIYCLEPRTGKQVWNFRAGLHIDASPIVSEGCVYISSGVSRRFRNTQVLCLDAGTGQVRWRQDVGLPAWGSPIVVGDLAYFGLGNGRLLTSAAPPEKPAGALLCVDTGTGATRFHFDVADAVLDRAAADAGRVYFTSRDAFCYAIDGVDGALLWRFDLGGPAVTTPAIAGKRLYVAPTPGPVFCLDILTGRPLASFDLAKWNGTEVRLLSSPVVFSDPDQESPADMIYLGSEVRGPLGSAGVLYAFRNPR